MDLFSTNALRGMVEDLRGRPVAASILSLFFPTILEEESEEIHFDSANKPRRIAPFVHPTLAGKIVESQGFSTKTFQPAYIKDKRVFDANRPLKRIMGEALTGSLTNAARMSALLALDIIDQMDMVARRKELMAVEAMRLGTVTVTGDGYDTVVVDFGRDAALDIDLSGGGAEWDDVGISPIENVEDWALLMAEKSGAGATDVVFSVPAWRLFKADPLFDKAVDQRRVAGVSDIDLGIRRTIGLQRKGTMGDLTLWTYSNWYVDTAGSEQKMLADNWVLMGSAEIEGVQCQGAIRDHSAGFVATEFYAKSWVEEDPSSRILLAQSAPLVVPYRPNASLAALVT